MEAEGLQLLCQEAKAFGLAPALFLEFSNPCLGQKRPPMSHQACHK